MKKFELIKPVAESKQGAGEKCIFLENIDLIVGYSRFGMKMKEFSIDCIHRNQPRIGTLYLFHSMPERSDFEWNAMGPWRMPGGIFISVALFVNTASYPRGVERYFPSHSVYRAGR